mmetsp:Transcript_20860/g.49394  ORF Transcript_20860/g.49394 Transcript_20860/m.49394 type:complete len:275 (-) Transcript_20860:46-870(-)
MDVNGRASPASEDPAAARFPSSSPSDDDGVDPSDSRIESRNSFRFPNTYLMEFNSSFPLQNPSSSSSSSSFFLPFPSSSSFRLLPLPPPVLPPKNAPRAEDEHVGSDGSIEGGGGGLIAAPEVAAPEVGATKARAVRIAVDESSSSVSVSSNGGGRNRDDDDEEERARSPRRRRRLPESPLSVASSTNSPPPVSPASSLRRSVLLLIAAVVVVVVAAVVVVSSAAAIIDRPQVDSRKESLRIGRCCSGCFCDQSAGASFSFLVGIFGVVLCCAV